MLLGAALTGECPTGIITAGKPPRTQSDGRKSSWTLAEMLEYFQEK